MSHKRKNNNYLKNSISRKPIHEIRVRQCKKIAFEIRNNATEVNTTEEILQYESSIINKVPANKNKDLDYPHNYNVKICNMSAETIPVSIPVKISIQPCNDNNSLSQNAEEIFKYKSSIIEESNLNKKFDYPLNNDVDNNTIINEVKENDLENFKNKLVKCFNDFNLKHTQIEEILNVLRTHNCMSKLPKTARCLMKTVTNAVSLRTVSPGKYLHIGFENIITKTLNRIPSHLIPNILLIDFHTDGAAEDRTSRIQIWPIQCKIVNIPHCQPETIGIYRGKKKPENAEDFFQDFTDECKLLNEKGGIFFNDRIIPFKFRAFIADAPARAFILNHYNHMSYNPCSKCKISGILSEKSYMVYLGTDFEPRTGEEYKQRIDEDHHKSGDTPLRSLLEDIVMQTPFEYMHFILLGLVKKTLSAFIMGKFGKLTKLSKHQINLIFKRLIEIVSYCPREFNRLPRPIEEFSNFKATEFLLYTGIVALHGIININAY